MQSLGRSLESKSCDFGAHIKPNSQQMAHATIDVEAALPYKFEFAAGVTRVLDGQQWWRQERRFALATVGMTCQDPSREVLPSAAIDRVGVVNQCD